MKEYDFDEMSRTLILKCDDVFLFLKKRQKCKNKLEFQSINFKMNKKLLNSFKKIFKKYIKCVKNVNYFNFKFMINNKILKMMISSQLEHRKSYH